MGQHGWACNITDGENSTDIGLPEIVNGNATAFKFYYVVALLQQARTELVMRERNSQWVADLLEEK
jgi:hypothetical protein